MSAVILEPAAKRFPVEYPFHIGKRLINHRDAEGNIVGHEYVPLTEEDYLHPEEDDEFMANDVHATTVEYLRTGIRYGTRDSVGIRMFSEIGIDWQRGEIPPHRPDATVFKSFDGTWDPTRGIFPVEDYSAQVLAVFEVTSPSTRHIDFGDKFDEFLQLRIPYYIAIDAAAPNRVPTVLGFRYVDGGYRELRRDEKLGVMVPPLKLWFRWQKTRLVIADEDGIDIPDFDELAVRADADLARADAENARAETEKARADAETTRADAETTRADALAKEVDELKAKLTGMG